MACALPFIYLSTIASLKIQTFGTWKNVNICIIGKKTYLFMVTIVLGRIHVNPNTRRSFMGKKHNKQIKNTPSKSI